MVGAIPDLTRICGRGWRSEGDLIYLLGQPLTLDAGSTHEDTHITLGGSEYLATIHGTVAGRPPRVNFDLERRVQKACREGIARGWVRSAHDCAEGGVAIALAEACISSQLGAEIHIGLTSAESQRWDEILFGEGGARILVSVSSDSEASWESYLQQSLTEDWQKIGRVGSASTIFKILTTDNLPLINVTLSDIIDCYYKAVERRLTVFS
jgi:phosphoribosylformylglycinamidine (FGAM) synthase-like enzyme